MDKLIVLIPLLPLIGFLANGLFGKWLKRSGGWLAVGLLFGSAAISISLFLKALCAAEAFEPIQVTLWQWLQTDMLNISIGFRVDQLTCLMLAFVTGVGSMVFLYSMGYMKGDPGFNRFFAYLCLFAFSMLTLVLGDSLPLLFVGWEGVGLCSYLLISFYLDLPGAADAGKKAFIVNRIGDFGFLVAMMMILATLGTLNIQEIVAKAPHAYAAGGTFVTVLTLAMFLGCTGKSAQIPLFVWLPDAMAGPTPVSALIHAATMVTAGIYLVVRMSVLFALAPATMMTIAVVAAATCFVAGTIALTQRDIKKVLAYSTVSQLGYMFLACGVGAFTAGIFHVFTHAFFKALLFLGAGSVIHAAHHEQDMFNYGAIKKWMPRTRWTYLLACCSIAGVPLFSGFFSKDEILWLTFDSGHGTASLLLYGVAAVTALMTAFYSFRTYFMTFEGKECRLDHHTQEHMHESPWTMTVPLILLAAGAVLAGFLNIPPAFTGHEGLVGRMLEPVVAPAHHILAGGHAVAHEGAEHAPKALEFGLMGFSICVAFLGIFLAWFLALKTWPNVTEVLARRTGCLFRLSFNRWWWDDVYNKVFAGGLRQVSRFASWFDRYVIDGFLHGIAAISRLISLTLRELQSGQAQAYAVMILLGANVILWLIFTL